MRCFQNICALCETKPFRFCEIRKFSGWKTLFEYSLEKLEMKLEMLLWPLANFGLNNKKSKFYLNFCWFNFLHLVKRNFIKYSHSLIFTFNVKSENQKTVNKEKNRIDQQAQFSGRNINLKSSVYSWSRTIDKG